MAIQNKRRDNAKLNEEQVCEIRRLWHTGRYTKAELARTYGVSSTQIKRIVRMEQW